MSQTAGWLQVDGSVAQKRGKNEPFLRGSEAAAAQKHARLYRDGLGRNIM